MNKNEFIESGYLELYVLGRLSDVERQMVEEQLDAHPDLQDELQSISKAFEALGHAVGTNPSSDLKQKLIKTLKDRSVTPPSSGKSNGWVTCLLLAALISGISAYLTWKSEETKIADLNQQNLALEERIDSLSNLQALSQEIIDKLYNPDNRVMAFDATENYPETSLKLIQEEATQKNYIQIIALPQLAANQSFQLWSLKGNDPPQPMDVFEGEGLLIEVGYVEGTDAYAITIEPRGGSQTPTLTNLIGIVNTAG